MTDAKTIDFRKTIFELTNNDREIIEIMRELGFDQVTNPKMIATVGRVMTIPKGARMRGIDLDSVRKAFQARGYTIVE